MAKTRRKLACREVLLSSDIGRLARIEDLAAYAAVSSVSCANPRWHGRIVTDTYNRYKNGVEDIGNIKNDVELLKQVTTEHSKQLNRIA